MLQAPDPAAELAPLWDLTPLPRPDHTRLYRLAPIGVGTATVESLTSYVIRLAAAHSVYPSHLIYTEIRPLLGKAYLGLPSSLSAIWPSGCAINATGPAALAWAQALETLTQRADLRYLTLLPWAEVLPHGGLVRQRRAWCPICYDTWQQAGQPLYEPLLWRLQSVRVCLSHACWLEEHCPTCQQARPVLAAWSRPGYCSHCLSWLGHSGAGDPAVAVPDPDYRVAQRIGTAVGDLLVAGPLLATPVPRAHIASMVRAWIARRTGGNILTFAQQLDLPGSTVQSWLRGIAIPELGTLLDLCARLGTTPRQFLTAPPEAAPVAAADAVSHAPLPCRRRRSASLWHAGRAAAAQEVLESVIRQPPNPPPSLTALARQIGYTLCTLQRKYPTLCAAVIRQYRDYVITRREDTAQRTRTEVRQLVYDLHNEGIYPSKHALTPRMAQPNLVRTAPGQQAYYQALRELGYRPPE